MENIEEQKVLKKFKVLLRDDSQDPVRFIENAVIVSDEPISKLMQHAHIREVYDLATDEDHYNYLISQGKDEKEAKEVSGFDPKAKKIAPKVEIKESK